MSDSDLSDNESHSGELIRQIHEPLKKATASVAHISQLHQKAVPLLNEHVHPALQALHFTILLNGILHPLVQVLATTMGGWFDPDDVDDILNFGFIGYIKVLELYDDHRHSPTPSPELVIEKEYSTWVRDKIGAVIRKFGAFAEGRAHALQVAQALQEVALQEYIDGQYRFLELAVENVLIVGQRVTGYEYTRADIQQILTQGYLGAAEVAGRLYRYVS